MPVALKLYKYWAFVDFYFFFITFFKILTQLSNCFLAVFTPTGVGCNHDQVQICVKVSELLQVQVKDTFQLSFQK